MNTKRNLSLCLFVVALVVGISVQAESTGRTRELLCNEWAFHLGDLEGADQPGFDDSGWRTLDVPLEENSGLVKEAYEKLGGAIEVKVIPGEGHNMSPKFFKDPELRDFMLKQTKE